MCVNVYFLPIKYIYMCICSHFLNNLRQIFLPSNEIELEGRRYNNIYFENISITS